ncbi:MAG: hypothetical protein ABH846_02010 [Patescibacteria group bacterium]
MKTKIIRIKDIIADMYKRRFFQITGITGLLLILFSVGFIYVELFPGLQDQVAIPLHYNVHFGIDMFGAWWQIFLFPIIGLAIYIINLILALFMWRKEKVLSHFFAVVSVVTSFITLISTVLIVLLNVTYD